MSIHRTHLQDHHGIEQQTLQRSELLGYLDELGKFNVHAVENRIFLPSSPRLAEALGITPHGGGPLRAYQEGILGQLDGLHLSRDGEAVFEGDPDATDRIVRRIEKLRDTIKAGLINGDLNTNTPLGQTPALTNQKIRKFFDHIETYYETHRQQVEALKTFSDLDHGWGAMVHTEPRIVSTLQLIQIDRRPIIRGGDSQLQRSGLSLAIANAHHDGRVNLSAGSILMVERTLGEEAAYRIRVPRDQQGFVTLGVLLGDASARTLVRSGGLLASGADAITTTRRAADLLEQGNATAAQSELNHALARNAGGWLGGTATAYVVGTSGFTPVALVAADALLMSKAFEKGADLLDNRAIYHQTDQNGVAWQFTGRYWQRQASIDRTADGVGNPETQAVGATYEKSRELGAQASRAAVELALGRAPAPQDPFNLEAQAADRRGLDNQNWQRDPRTEQWSRQVKVGVSGVNDRGIYTSEVATPERSRLLNAQALERIEGNIAHGREAMAAAWLESFAAQRMQDHLGAVPAAVQAARARPDVVLGSDNRRYERNEAGRWLHAGQPAQGNLALELELTRLIRQPSLQRFEQTLAQIQARPAPTPAQQDQYELLHRYHAVGTQLNPQWQQAIALATERTRQAYGLGAGTLQELQRGEDGQLGANSPIVHYQTGADGVARRVAVTRSEAIEQAWNEIRAQQAQPVPLPDAPTMQITPLSPQEREAYQQALREANRQGASLEEAQQAAGFAAMQLHRPQVDETAMPPVVSDLQRERRGATTSGEAAGASESVANASTAAHEAAVQTSARLPAQPTRLQPQPTQTPPPPQPIIAHEPHRHETPRREADAHVVPPPANMPFSAHHDVQATATHAPIAPPSQCESQFATSASATATAGVDAAPAAELSPAPREHPRQLSFQSDGLPASHMPAQRRLGDPPTPLPSLSPPHARDSSGLHQPLGEAHRPPCMTHADTLVPAGTAAPVEPAKPSWEELAQTMRALRIRIELEMELEDRLAAARQARVERGESPWRVQAERRHYDRERLCATEPPWQRTQGVLHHSGAAQQHDQPPPIRRTITGGRAVDDLLHAIDCKNDVGIEEALKRVAASPFSIALAQRGHEILDAQALQEAQAQAACQPPDMEVSAEIQTRRGPVRVLTLPQFANGPVMPGGPHGEGAGDGGG